MIKKLTLSLFLCFFLSCNANHHKLLKGKVIGILDGDTITILDSKKEEHRIRLAEIDAPERGQPFGKKSKETLSNLIFQKEVKVYWDTKDRFHWKTKSKETKKGRIIGTVYKNNLDINKIMIQKGMAWHYKSFSKSEILAKEERNAQKNKLGIWSLNNPIPPWEYRRKRK
jgi:endonuclease YncB( thermonuclease family)